MKYINTTIEVAYKEMCALPSKNVVKMACVGTNGNGLGQFTGYADISFSTSDLQEGSDILDFIIGLERGNVIHIPVTMTVSAKDGKSYFNCKWNRDAGLPVLTDKTVTITEKSDVKVAPALAAILKPFTPKEEKEDSSNGQIINLASVMQALANKGGN